jgi:hypothetical protein
MEAAKRTCTIQGCNGAHSARGLCKKHYQAASWHGTLDKHPTTTPKLSKAAKKRRGRIVVAANKGTNGAVREVVVIGQFISTKLKELASDYFLRGEDAIAIRFRDLAKQAARARL